MIASAFAAIALSGDLSPLVVAGTIIAGAASYFFDPNKNRFLESRLWQIGWNAATIGLFVWKVAEAISGAFLLAGVGFLCFLLVNKLWNRKSSRDYLHAYVISFLMLVAASAMNTDLVYAGCFVAYIVFATWTLTLFHLRREMEENYLLKHSDDAQSERVEVDRILNSRRIVGASFLAGTSLVSLGIFVVSALVFFLIPRFGFGFFMSQNRRGVSTVGFSERVELGEYGRVKDNPQVIMRVELPSGSGSTDEPLRLRGVSFDRYQHGHWSRSTLTTPPPLQRHGNLWFVDSNGTIPIAKQREKLTHLRAQHVYLDPLDTAVLFGQVQPYAFELPQRNVGGPPRTSSSIGGGDIYALERHVDRDGRSYGVERKSGIRYTVYSDPALPDVAALKKAAELTKEHREALRPYLQLPIDLAPRIVELARTVTAQSKSPFTRARALEQYLSTKFRYTLDLGRDERFDPIEDFLFVQRAGHCEYFASAMAIMLRTVGIPSRSVNGFLGGEWNAYGKYVAIRQGDAHSWVEAWIEGVGWVTFDPTPVGPARTQQGFLNRMKQLLDTVELTWFKYVIEYDLRKQADFVGGVRQSLRSFGGSSGVVEWLRKRAKPGLATLGGLAIAAWIFFEWRRRGGKGLVVRRRPERAAHAFEKAVRALERRGYVRAMAETGRELAVRVERGGDQAAPDFSRLVDLYYAARFGRLEVESAELDRLARKVASPPPKV
jgi:transglutaminase-like putative cysteine protease